MMQARLYTVRLKAKDDVTIYHDTLAYDAEDAIKQAELATDGVAQSCQPRQGIADCYELRLTPKAGENWMVQLPGRHDLQEVQVKNVAQHYVSFRVGLWIGPDNDSVHYELAACKFVEQIIRRK